MRRVLLLFSAALFALAGAMALWLPVARAAESDEPSPATKQALSSLIEGSFPLYVLGDLNQDGRVDQQDRKLLVELIAARAKGAPAALAKAKVLRETDLYQVY